MQRTYLAIDLKSYYASAECAARHHDPLTTNLVVADSSRTEKTICLAVSPSLKAYGISGRARLFEVMQKVKEVNANRLREAVRLRKAVYKDGNPSFSSASYDSLSLAADPSLELSYLVAPPRMAYYEKVSRQIYGIYLKYIAPEDIVVYSIDEVFIDATSYLSHYHMTAHDLAMTMIREVLYTTGITATAGIGTNLYLAKLAMDITAKHAAPDKDGVRIAELDEESFRKAIKDERAMELCFEYTRRFDLIRWGDYYKLMQEQVDKAQADESWKFGINVYTYFNIPKSYNYFPIPANEIGSNGAIKTNNPGW